MVKITATSFVIEGEPVDLNQLEGLKDIVSRFAAANIADVTTPNTLQDSDDTRDAKSGAAYTPWTQDEVQRFLNSIKPEARQILTELAKRPDGYPFEDLQKVLGKPGKTIGGNLSTVGATVKRFEGKRRPIQTNYSRKLWTMDPDFANAIRAIS